MPVIKQEIEIDAPKDEVWEILANLGAIEDFHPGVKKSYYLPGADRGIGASRHCDLKPFGSVDETATAWTEGESYTLELHNGKGLPPFKKATGTLGVRESGGRTYASMRLEYSLRFGLVGRIMDAMVVRRQFSAVVPAVLSGLKKHVEGKAS